MKLTIEEIHGLVAQETYFTHGTLTLCVLDLTNGAQVTGESNCIDPANHDAEIGRKVALENAIDKIWKLEGYALKTRGAHSDG